MACTEKWLVSPVDFFNGVDWPFEAYWWFRKRKECLRLVLKQLSYLKERGALPPLMVDLGCGNGKDLCIFAKHLLPVLENWIFRGCDQGPACREKFLEHVEWFKLHQVDIAFEEVDLSQPLPFADCSVGFVHCSEVAEHMPDPAALIKEITRILHPGGLLLFTSTNQPSCFELEFYNRLLRPESSRDKQTPPEPVAYGSSGTPLYGHISVKTIRQWESLLLQHKLQLVDAGRGAIRYDVPCLKYCELFVGVMLAAEWLLDLVLPRKISRFLASGLIGIYRKVS